jgi:hypothetical protein
MREGWVKIYRSLLEWEWYSDIPTKTVFIHLLLSANHADASYRGRKILRGQRWTSIGHLANETGLTVKQVRAAIEKLQSTKELTSEGASDGTMITICKYDSYQEMPTPKGKQKGEQKANKGQATGQTKGNKQEEEEGFEEEQQGKKSVPPPPIESVIAYFIENGYTEDAARRAWNYYNASLADGGMVWKDGKGQTVKSWKQKMQSVWFKDEYKIEQPREFHRPKDPTF